MKAIFDLEALHEPVLVIEPERGLEAILAAAFIRYDENVFYVSVERYEDGQIRRLTLHAQAKS